jgi:hypothetical protein
MTRSRRYWVVSPNVRGNESTVSEWRAASVLHKAAFMGWGFDHRLGHKFANTIFPDDVILLARRHSGEPEIVGFGKVRGTFKRRLPGLRPPATFGSARMLSPFIPISRPPKDLPLPAAVNQSAALHELHPNKNDQHKSICEWMDKRLQTTDRTGLANPSHIKFAELPHDDELEYQVRTKLAIKQALKKEAALVSRYAAWVNRQGRSLRVFRKANVRCDLYEAARNNLIEAKCSAARAYIRMAVGQLLDYDFASREEISKCNKAVLLPSKPHSEIIEWLKSIEISTVWEERSSFLDNADGQFT